MDMIIEGWQAFSTSQVGRVLTSVEAQRSYAALALLAVFALSLWLARMQLNLLKGVRAVELEADERISGPEPKLARTIQSRLDRYRARRAEIVGGVWQALGALILFGLILPGGVVFSAVWMHDWLLPDYAAPILIGEAAPTSGHETGLGAVLVFLVDQVFRGALADIPEVFRLGLTPVSNNPDNAVISWLIVIYRFAAGIVSGSALYMMYRVWRGVPRIDRRIRDYELRLRKAEAEAGAGA